MQDSIILAAAMASRKAYNEVAHHVDLDDFTPTGAYWWKQLVSHYETDPDAAHVDFTLFRDRGEREAGRTAQLSVEWLDAIDPPVSPDNVAWELLELKRLVSFRKMVAAHENEPENRDLLLDVTAEHNTLLQATGLQSSKVDYGPDLEDLTEILSAKNRIPLFPAELSKRTRGGAIPGTFILAIGRKESGKTLFAVDNTAGWLRAGYRVLYVSNEDTGAALKARIRQNISGMTVDQWAADHAEGVRRVHVGGMWDRLCVVHLWPGSTPEIEKLVLKFKPHCLVVDQIRNMHSTKRTGTRAQELDQVACDVRQMLSKYGLVGLALGQANAGEPGKYKLYLDTSDFDESRTGVPGQADLMVGIGFNPQLDAHNQRAISLPANKLSGDHGNFIVSFDKERSKYL